MFIAKAHLKSLSPYSQSRYHATPKKDKEGPADYEERTWRQRMHTTEDGFVFIPPMAFKNCLAEAAKYLSMQIPGKGKQTYTKHIEGGVLVLEPLILPDKKDQVEGLELFVPPDGRRGGSKRVMKTFPVIQQWAGEVTFSVFDETITEEVFRYHLEQAGKFIGIGFFRPRNNGYFGRFEVEAVEWVKAT